MFFFLACCCFHLYIWHNITSLIQFQKFDNHNSLNAPWLHFLSLLVGFFWKISFLLLKLFIFKRTIFLSAIFTFWFPFLTCSLWNTVSSCWSVLSQHCWMHHGCFWKMVQSVSWFKKVRKISVIRTWWKCGIYNSIPFPSMVNISFCRIIFWLTTLREILLLVTLNLIIPCVKWS